MFGAFKLNNVFRRSLRQARRRNYSTNSGALEPPPNDGSMPNGCLKMFWGIIIALLLCLVEAVLSH